MNADIHSPGPCRDRARQTRVIGAARHAGGSSERTWSPGDVEERLRKAVVLRTAFTKERLVDEIASRQASEGVGIIGGIGVAAIGCSEGDEVTAEAMEALSWLRWLDPHDAGIVTARLEGAPWKMICWRFGISRPTADRRWRYARALLAWRLNGHARLDQAPSLRSLLGFRHDT